MQRVSSAYIGTGGRNTYREELLRRKQERRQSPDPCLLKGLPLQESQVTRRQA